MSGQGQRRGFAIPAVGSPAALPARIVRRCFRSRRLNFPWTSRISRTASLRIAALTLERICGRIRFNSPGSPHRRGNPNHRGMKLQRIYLRPAHDSLADDLRPYANQPHKFEMATGIEVGEHLLDRAANLLEEPSAASPPSGPPDDRLEACHTLRLRTEVRILNRLR
jgi:hypothetical protein